MQTIVCQLSNNVFLKKAECFNSEFITLDMYSIYLRIEEIKSYSRMYR